MSLRPQFTAVSATAVAALVLFTAGCSGSSDTAEKASSPKSSAASPSSGPAAEQKDKVDNGAAAANIDPANPPKAIASLTAPLPYDEDPKTTGRFDVYSLKRQGKLVLLTFSLTPNFSTAKPASLFLLQGGRLFDPTLTDPVNLRAYRVVKADGRALSSGNNQSRSHSGEPMFLWAAFAAPPTNVEKVNLNIFDTLPTFIDVPIQ